MILSNITAVKHFEREYFLGDIIGVKIIFHGKKIGNLSDLIIEENDTYPLITYLIVARPFGALPCIVPMSHVCVMTRNEIVINNINDLTEFEGEPSDEKVLLKDHILYKRVLDLEGRELAVVYDVRIVPVDGNFYVREVDLSRHRYFKKMRIIGPFLNLIDKLKGNLTDKLVSWNFIEPLPSDIGSFKGDLKLKLLKEKFMEMNPIDLADVLEELDQKQRKAIFSKLNRNYAASTLEEIDPYFQRELISSLPKEKIGELLNQMTPGQAADILAILPYGEKNELLKLINVINLKKVKAIIEKQEEKILNYATTQIIKLSPRKTAGEIRGQYENIAKEKKVVMYLYVVDSNDKLLGVLDIKELLEAEGNKLLRDIMIENYISLEPYNTLREALALFERYDFRAIPIVNQSYKLLGVITYRDIKRLKHRFFE